MPSTDIKDYWRRSWGIGDRVGFDTGGMAKVVAYVESLPKGTTVTTKMIEDFVSKNKIDVNITNFFQRKAPNIKNKIFDTSFQGSRLTDVEKANIEKFGKEKYSKLNSRTQMRVRKGTDVGALAPEKLKKNVYKKEYNKAYKWYQSKGLKIDELAEETIRKNISKNKKFVVPTRKLKAEPGLTTLFKNYSEKQLIKDLKAGKAPYEIAIEYFNKNNKEVLKLLEGKKEYTRPLGRLSTDLMAKISQNPEAKKLHNKIKKSNSFKKLPSSIKYKKDLEILLPYAQEQGLIPKVNAKGVPIDTASKYFQHAYKTKADPIAKLFNYAERVGIEHPGGVARAVIFNDPGTLNEIVATMPESNIAKGATFDRYATGQAQSFKTTGDSKYIKAINKISNQAYKEFGSPKVIYDVKESKVVRRPTKFSLKEPDLFIDSKSYINEYISKGGSNRESFKKLDKVKWGPHLKDAIIAFENKEPVKGNAALKTALAIAKGIGKGAARTVGAAIPIIGPAMVAWGMSDVAKAAEKGLTSPDELAVAYNVGPDVAQMWSDFKPKMKQNIEDMTVEGNIYEGDTRGYDNLTGVDQYIINRHK